MRVRSVTAGDLLHAIRHRFHASNTEHAHVLGRQEACRAPIPFICGVKQVGWVSQRTLEHMTSSGIPRSPKKDDYLPLKDYQLGEYFTWRAGTARHPKGLNNLNNNIELFDRPSVPLNAEKINLRCGMISGLLELVVDDVEARSEVV